MDALDDIRRLIDETEQEVKKTAVKRRCWGLHRWTPWVDFPLHQERRCAWCNKREMTKVVPCEHPQWEVLEFGRAHKDAAWIGYGSLQRCTTCGDTASIIDKF